MPSAAIRPASEETVEQLALPTPEDQRIACSSCESILGDRAECLDTATDLGAITTPDVFDRDLAYVKRWPAFNRRRQYR